MNKFRNNYLLILQLIYRGGWRKCRNYEWCELVARPGEDVPPKSTPRQQTPEWGRNRRGGRRAWPPGGLPLPSVYQPAPALPQPQPSQVLQTERFVTIQQLFMKYSISPTCRPILKYTNLITLMVGLFLYISRLWLQRSRIS